MNITIVTPPPVEPVTIAEAYAHLRWDAEPGSPIVYPLEDLVTGNIKTAREDAEAFLRRSLVMQTLRLSTSSFRDLELLRPPFISLVGVAYINEAGVSTDLDITDFYVTDDLVPRLCPYARVVDACSDLDRSRSDCVRVTYVAGYAPVYDSASPPNVTSYAANIPQSFKDSILIGVQLLCDRFDPDEKGALEKTRDRLLMSQKVETW